MNTDKNDTARSESGKDVAEWRAFRYILGEMSSADADAFEEILATDQATRELVARSTGLVTNLLELDAVEATGAGSHNGSFAAALARPSVAVVRPVTSAARRSERLGGWAITGLAAAVCCCVAIGVCLISWRVPTGLEEISSGDLSDGGADHLVAIWSQRLAESAPETATTDTATTETATTESVASERSEVPLLGDGDDSRTAPATENASADSTAVGDQIADDESDVPGWMIAAVELGQVRNPDGSASEIREN